MDAVCVSAVEPVSSMSVPFHVTPITWTGLFVLSSFEVILFVVQGTVSFDEGKSKFIRTTLPPTVPLVTVAQIVNPVCSLAITPVGPGIAVGTIVTLLASPHVWSLAADDICKPAPGVGSLLLFVSGPDELPFALQIGLW